MTRSDSQARRLVRIARDLEGTLRAAGRHEAAARYAAEQRAVADAASRTVPDSLRHMRF